MRYLLGACLLTIATASPCADASSPIDGSWLLTYPSAFKSGEASATLVVSNGAGTWRYIAQTALQGKNPCYGRPFPVSIVSQDGRYVLTINASTVMQGCTDFKLTMEVVDGKEPAGTFEGGREIHFVRQ